MRINHICSLYYMVKLFYRMQSKLAVYHCCIHTYISIQIPCIKKRLTYSSRMRYESLICNRPNEKTKLMYKSKFHSTEKGRTNKQLLIQSLIQIFETIAVSPLLQWAWMKFIEINYRFSRITLCMNKLVIPEIRSLQWSNWNVGAQLDKSVFNNIQVFY